MEEEKVITQGGRYTISNTNSEQQRTRLLLFTVVVDSGVSGNEKADLAAKNRAEKGGKANREMEFVGVY